MVANMDNFVVEKSSGMTTLFLPKCLREGHDLEFGRHVMAIAYQNPTLPCLYIVCDGAGGPFGTAVQLAKAIHTLPTRCVTVIDTLAISAHSLLFAAGKQRIMLKQSSQIGFHRAQFPDDIKKGEEHLVAEAIQTATAKYYNLLEAYFGRSLPQEWFEKVDITYITALHAMQMGLCHTKT